MDKFTEVNTSDKISLVINDVEIEISFFRTAQTSQGDTRLYGVLLEREMEVYWFVHVDKHYSEDVDLYHANLIDDVLQKICDMFDYSLYEKRNFKSVITQDWVDSMKVARKLSE